MKKAAIFLLSIFLISSCTIKEPLGIWDDNILLSTRNIELSADTDSAIVTTGGNWWWIDGISYNDSIYMYYGSEEVDLESDSYTIAEEDFIIERRNKNTLFIKLLKNETGAERLMTISLEAGDYFDYVAVKQVAK
ncbi:MAG: hypothetical protein P1P88_05810 [Bacteroidales bacterium]|nr:hypothetical protein [Bacteroidales bacterium]